MKIFKYSSTRETPDNSVDFKDQYCNNKFSFGEIWFLNKKKSSFVSFSFLIFHWMAYWEVRNQKPYHYTRPRARIETKKKTNRQNERCKTSHVTSLVVLHPHVSKRECPATCREFSTPMTPLFRTFPRRRSSRAIADLPRGTWKSWRWVSTTMWAFFRGNERPCANIAFACVIRHLLVVTLKNFLWLFSHTVNFLHAFIILYIRSESGW